MKNAIVVSRILNGLKALSKDDRTSKRYALSVARQKAEFYIAAKLNDRSLYREDNLYKSLDCFGLKKIDTIKCDVIEFRTCNNIMKSIKKLPPLVYSKYGNTLKEVTNLDGTIDFRVTTPSEFRRDKNRQGKDPFIRFYVKDGYLYLLDTIVKSVNLYLLTLETEKIAELSECSTDDCLSLWEHDFVCPSKLIENVVTETIKEIAGSKQMPTDTNPNMDSNQKGKTVN